jgi:hypothetical protein
MTTEQRLEKLERQNRWMRRIGAVGVAVAAAVFLIGQGDDPTQRTLELRKLILRDGNGKRRAELAVTEKGRVALAFWDLNGKIRAHVGLGDEDKPFLSLKSADKKTAVLLAVGESGRPYIFAGGRKTGAHVQLSGDTITMYDKDRKCRVGLSADDPLVLLFDKGGKARVALDSSAEGLILMDEQGKRRAVFSTDSNGKSTITMYDAKGDVIWQAPR